MTKKLRPHDLYHGIVMQLSFLCVSNRRAIMTVRTHLTPNWQCNMWVWDCYLYNNDGVRSCLFVGASGRADIKGHFASYGVRSLFPKELASVGIALFKTAKYPCHFDLLWHILFDNAYSNVFIIKEKSLLQLEFGSEIAVKSWFLCALIYAFCLKALTMAWDIYHFFEIIMLKWS